MVRIFCLHSVEICEGVRMEVRMRVIGLEKGCRQNVDPPIWTLHMTLMEHQYGALIWSPQKWFIFDSLD